MSNIKRHLAYLALTFFAIVRVGFSQASQPPFSVAISGPSEVRLGDPIKLLFIVKNTSDRTFVFECTGRAELDFRIDMRDEASAAPPKNTGGWALGAHLAFVHKKPGEVLEASTDLGRLFVLKPGIYTVRVSRVEGSRPPVHIGAEQKDLVVATSNTITVRVVP